MSWLVHVLYLSAALLVGAMLLVAPNIGLIPQTESTVIDSSGPGDRTDVCANAPCRQTRLPMPPLWGFSKYFLTKDEIEWFKNARGGPKS